MSEIKKLIGVDRAAEALSVKKSWVYRAVREGKLVHVKMGKYLRFPEDIANQVMKQGPK